MTAASLLDLRHQRCEVCGQPCRATASSLPTIAWPPEQVPTRVCRGEPYVTATGVGTQAWGIHYDDDVAG